MSGQHRVVCCIYLLQFSFGFRRFQKDALLDNLIRRGGREGQSRLKTFQEAAQKIEDKNEYALAPFYLFYDTVHTFLDSSIRRVIERCERAATDGNGIELYFYKSRAGYPAPRP